MKSSTGFNETAVDKSTIHGGATLGIGGTIVNLENITIAAY
jgi:hypothetical protein